MRDTEPSIRLLGRLFVFRAMLIGLHFLCAAALVVVYLYSQRNTSLWAATGPLAYRAVLNSVLWVAWPFLVSGMLAVPRITSRYLDFSLVAASLLGSTLVACAYLLRSPSRSLDAGDVFTCCLLLATALASLERLFLYRTWEQ